MYLMSINTREAVYFITLNTASTSEPTVIPLKEDTQTIISTNTSSILVKNIGAPVRYTAKPIN